MNDGSVALTSKIERIKTSVQRFFGPWGVFFKGFLKHPVMVGSIIPRRAGRCRKCSPR
jgi:phosphatidylethanolamine/phosphatidyl-N-methylethanolamine N-methyltransferase